MKIEQYVKKSLLFAIGSSYNRIWRELNLRLQEQKLNILQAMILISLFFEDPEAVNPSSLAESLLATRGNISHCLSKLEKRGFVRRTLSMKDARSYQITLKPEGKRQALRLIKLMDGLEGLFEKRFGRDHVLATVQRLRSYEVAHRETLS
jgi:DNA-binding MarR family transcriptional regulator